MSYRYCYLQSERSERQSTDIVDDESIPAATLKQAIRYILDMSWDDDNASDHIVVYAFCRPAAFIHFIPEHHSRIFTTWPSVAVITDLTHGGRVERAAEEFGYGRRDDSAFGD